MCVLCRKCVCDEQFYIASCIFFSKAHQCGRACEDTTLNEALIAELGVLESVFKFLNVPSEVLGTLDQHPIVAVLSVAWSSLSGLFVSRAADEGVITKLCDIMVAVTKSANEQSGSLLEPFIGYD
jgi:hypothetical protein